MALPGRTAAVLVAFSVLTACVAPERQALQTGVERALILFEARSGIDQQLQHLALRGRTEYRVTRFQGRAAIQATGRISASGLIRKVRADIAECPEIEWSWAVTVLQPSADLHLKERDDVSASLFLLFGNPGFLSDPQPVPTLRYVWTNHRAHRNVVIDNPYMPGIVRSLVVRSGKSGLGKWMRERRNLATDYRRAFGNRPPADLHAIVLFTDNDQTGEAVEAYYGDGRLICR